MSIVIESKRAASINPLKSSQPLGAALAFLGIDQAIPLFHGSQGCTSFAVVLAVRHFKEAIPLQTTAMNEVSTILGGHSNLEEALLNLTARVNPRFIGVASTALVETRGEDYIGALKDIRARNPDLASRQITFAATPDYSGALEDGWANAVSAIIDDVVIPWTTDVTSFQQINVLPGIHQTAADIEALRDIIESFGLYPVILPDISGSLDGHVPENWMSTTMGGTRMEEVANMARAVHTIAIGEHMRKPADLLESLTGVPTTLFPDLTGLTASDQLMALLARLSGKSIPVRYRRQRSQLVDAMLDGHFYFGGKKVAIAADPDLLVSLSRFFNSMGAQVSVAVSSTPNSPHLKDLPTEKVIVGDLTDFEDAVQEVGADMLITHSHGRQASKRLGIPLFRVGFPIFDRIGNARRLTLGYQGTQDLIFRVANLFLDQTHTPKPADFVEGQPDSPIEENLYA
ncbi:nitrogenase iron-molybdenum cofactor biosynthesis protein NifN [Zymomonas mobilis]|uniref:Nitrogenase iron-molybdenum cofactor biosynthesis protein NifN n=1 Tax=Zymomonas mobilis subsp. pomaceae (strain ATCC 29192 / DSM 22645 / JCM 10191 / CCUG 17912 / NBRC 13757 / NCIMB 11200 / NRRL B-4491 / Barker I) TaxID=579138 RepID=F8EUQ2_ZYMMT|nr:nitrogenase iron-molybdenum cofactor biosynthesis protein NifN [Zymomonas mobilis]AEI38198.1 nitrogenase molybdenum-iron cofactor biosynthesis protein NifN [Zymomonas mobilis subsp. pomaceae ATCC 29192]MDX5947888.1 nitrogenase iron-molybdenum cofactor biosynthesis protein NifN [Zymomonas mobilis subsp. pomaceae]GEB89948.1 nitrogenase molybdenum-cofactor biosynthesis protein NifN [Zymomonas mobilis subsp. pomaceae]